jgi:hypothetical protein
MAIDKEQFEKILVELGGAGNIAFATHSSYDHLKLFIVMKDFSKADTKDRSFYQPPRACDLKYWVFEEECSLAETWENNYYEAFLNLTGQKKPGEEKTYDSLTFGRFDRGNGVEPIEWLILDTAEGGRKKLLISRYALCCRQYNKFELKTTWETAPLRQWLNQEFLEEAFTPEEAAKICVTDVKAEKSPAFIAPDAADPGNDTQDKVFLLSAQEACRYFPYDEVRTASASKAVLPSIRGDYSIDTAQWWLRSTGRRPYEAAYVMEYGQLRGDMRISAKNVAVRPAMWVEF